MKSLETRRKKNRKKDEKGREKREEWRGNEGLKRRHDEQFPWGLSLSGIPATLQKLSKAISPDTIPIPTLCDPDSPTFLVWDAYVSAILNYMASGGWVVLLRNLRLHVHQH